MTTTSLVRPVILLLLSVLMTCCVPQPTAVSSPGYYGVRWDESSEPGELISKEKNSIVTIGAGLVDIGEESYWHAWYLIDRRTRTCWFKIGASLGEIDCCNLSRLHVARQYMVWLKVEKCQKE